MQGYARCKHVRYVERNRIFRIKPYSGSLLLSRSVAGPSLLSRDPLLRRQWGLAKVAASQAWNLARTSPSSVRIAILDTGIDPKHPDLAGKIILNRNFSDSRTTDDLFGHGTHVAGIAAAVTNNGLGVAGMSFNAAKLMNIKVLGDDGAGTTAAVAKGIVYAAMRGAHVISMSLGASFGAGALRDAVAIAAGKGAILVAAAGNDGRAGHDYPASYPQVISVAATNRNNRKSGFSNYGAAVDVAAPGVSIWSTIPTHRNVLGMRNYGALSGTSQATPFVSGLAALIKATFPRLNRVTIRKAIEMGSDRVPGFGVLYRYGRINARRALDFARRSSLRANQASLKLKKHETAARS